ncbi:unnamed protein product, partial [Iphiclides podalirius]
MRSVNAGLIIGVGACRPGDPSRAGGRSRRYRGADLFDGLATAARNNPLAPANLAARPKVTERFDIQTPLPDRTGCRRDCLFVNASSGGFGRRKSSGAAKNSIKTAIGISSALSRVPPGGYPNCAPITCVIVMSIAIIVHGRVLAAIDCLRQHRPGPWRGKEGNNGNYSSRTTRELLSVEAICRINGSIIMTAGFPNFWH